jgi:hypothetical protein
MSGKQVKVRLVSNAPVYEIEDLVKEIVCLCNKIKELENQPTLTPQSSRGPKVKFDKPGPYNGTKGALHRFLTKLRAYFIYYNDDFSYEFTKVLFTANRLSGNILDWFEPTLRDYLDHKDNPDNRHQETQKIFGKYKEFETAIKGAFGDLNKEHNTEQQLTVLKQTKSASAYATRFRQLASKPK